MRDYHFVIKDGSLPDGTHFLIDVDTGVFVKQLSSINLVVVKLVLGAFCPMYCDFSSLVRAPKSE